MEKKVKVIANYLPQFHQIPENDRFWGRGFTEWVSVKKAKPVYEGQYQPRSPLDGDYYDLSQYESIKKQVFTAKKYGIYGFAIYHYWFSSNMNLLSTPSEILLKHRELDINFFFIWDNNSWKRTWSNVRNGTDWMNPDNEIPNDGEGILAQLEYGSEKEWKEHFDYLLPFFKDERYIKFNNRPVFGFFQPQNDYACIRKMESYWDNLARLYGFDGVYCMSRDDWKHSMGLNKKFKYSPMVYTDFINYLSLKIKLWRAEKFKKLKIFDYDECWNKLLREARKSNKDTILSGFVRYDDTPRRGKNAKIIVGETPEKFYKYFSELISISKKQDKEYVLLTAWNEWGEGAYLEADEMSGYKYLEAVNKAVEEQ